MSPRETTLPRFVVAPVSPDVVLVVDREAKPRPAVIAECPSAVEGHIVAGALNDWQPGVPERPYAPEGHDVLCECEACREAVHAALKAARS